MTGHDLKDKTVKGVIWSSIERFSVQGVQFLVILVIARILEPKDFGLVGMLAVFMAVAQSFIDSGFSQALIRKQDRTDVDSSTVFYFNIAVSVCLYLLLYAIAPFVADFYNESQLCSLMRVLCFVVIINGFAIVQRAVYSASLNFSKSRVCCCIIIRCRWNMACLPRLWSMDIGMATIIKRRH